MKATKKDLVLTKLIKIMWKGQNWIPKNSPDKLKKFKPILDILEILGIAITGNDILIKSDRIILLIKLQTEAIPIVGP